MQRMHIHTFGWMHPHRSDWHILGVRLEHIVHDPRFWAGVTLAILFGLMVLAMIFTKPGSGATMPTSYPDFLYPP